VTEWLTFDGFTNLVCGVCGRDLPCRKAS
jgi:hypothetical protein